MKNAMKTGIAFAGLAGLSLLGAYLNHGPSADEVTMHNCVIASGNTDASAAVAAGQDITSQYDAEQFFGQVSSDAMACLQGKGWQCDSNFSTCSKDGHTYDMSTAEVGSLVAKAVVDHYGHN